ncbi:uncharacterized protein LOC124138972 isoform X1 [Haliotis rufescens]|uniref:uncharacterized protein LOC124138972 isoform X1 n=1 Tax=Haliotis rufescens TaxID=6454 RepID=UPI00201EC00F|nr:uncharacterized protein LOC124138972 isoform X1 [Haliotis rufescens]
MGRFSTLPKGLCGILFVGFSIFFYDVAANGNFLYVSNGTHIIKINRLNGHKASVFFQHDGRIIGLAADIDDGWLFWSDISSRRKSIYRSRLDGTDVTVILRDVEECNGLSVDWISNHVYWTDAQKQTIEVANYDGSGRRILIGFDLDKPRGIVVDPVYGYVFWADQGSKKIERVWLDGSHRIVLVNNNLHWPNQLAVSYGTRRLYWVDQRKQHIMSCNIDGKDITKERDLSKIANSDPVFGLVVFGNTAIFSTWFSAGIHSTLVATRLSWRDETITTLSGSRELFSLVATTQSMQPPSNHPCGQEDRGGCSHLCLPTRGTSYRCACPSFGGLALSSNSKSCEVPSELLFFTLKDSGDIGFISLTGGQSPDLTLVGRSPSPSAVSYDPIEQFVYWSDTTENIIYRTSLDGSEREVFLNCSHGVGVVDGLAVDWEARRLYFTNMGHSTPGLDGVVYSWHRIEVISLDGRNRKTVVTDVESPRGLDLDMRNGFLFYGDWGKKPKIVASLLDGSKGDIILDSGLSNPNGLTFYNGHLYVADSNFNNLTSSPHLMVYDVYTATWQQLKLSTNVSLPMGLAVRGDTLYYTDWVSMESSTGYLKSYDLRYGVDNTVMLTGQKPTGLHYSPLARRRQEAAEGSCEHTGCSNECVRVPSSPAHPMQCMCPDESAKILTSNKVTCDRPQNFLLYADLNTLKLNSLDPESEEATHTLLYSDIKSNFIAVAYDERTDTIYWSDINKRAIFSSPFNDISPQLVYQSIHHVDGLTIDGDRQRLFWTGYLNNGSGIIARINLQRGKSSYHEIVTGLHSPRAILHIPKKKLLFWTEYGTKMSPPSVHKSRANGKHHKVIMSEGLVWPNALTVQEDKLFVGDGWGKVFTLKFDGNEVKELMFLTGASFHIFGMVVFENALFYSDWHTHSVYMVDMVTGDQETIATHLSRPTAVVIYHPASLKENNLCTTSRGERVCSNICVPVPRSYHCTCSVGSKLAADGKNCIQMSSPWEMTEEFRCGQDCGDKAHCAQLIPELKYQCVCQGGYQGDGIECESCSPDSFKAFLGNSTCTPCPVGMTTRGVPSATECVCEDRYAHNSNGTCVCKSGSQVKQEYSVDFNGTCDPGDDYLKTELRDTALRYLARYDLCQMHHCQFTDLTIGCIETGTKKRWFNTKQFQLRWNITYNDCTGQNGRAITKDLVSIKRKLEDLAMTLKVSLDKQVYSTIPGNVKVSPPHVACLADQYQGSCGKSPPPAMTTEAAMTSEEMTSAEIIVSSSAETMAPLDATTERSGYMTSEEVTEDDLDLVTMDEVTVEMTDSLVTTAPNIVRSEVTTASVMIVTEKKEEVQVARGKPYFEGCPQGELKVMELDSNSKTVKLSTDSLIAMDSYGSLLPINSNYPITDGHITLPWQANGKAGQHTVLFQAEDNWKQKTTCQFQVIINDSIPPKFTFCPNIKPINTNHHRQKVTWNIPVATDNVEVPTVTGSHKPDTEFKQGTTIINYTAVDKAGNTAICNFTVIVIQKQSCTLPSIKNGAFVCGHDHTKIDNCYIACDKDFVLHPVIIFSRPFNCMVVKDIVQLTGMLQYHEPCLRKRLSRTVRQEFSLSFNGPCDPDDNNLKAQLSISVLKYLDTRNLCQWAECTFGNITIHCGPTSTKQRRYVEDQFHVKWNITIDNSTGFSRAQVESILMNINLVLVNLAKFLSINVDEQQYTTVPGTVRRTPLQWVCQTGAMVYDDGCVSCPVGTLHNSSIGRCALCPRGYYQDKERQTQCQRCPEGFTKEEGAVGPAQCVSFPSIDEMSKFLIITACTFGFVFLCMVIFMYTQYQRQQKQARKSLALANASRYMMPNIYVAPPPLPKAKFNEKPSDARDYLGYHDYEDIDGAANTKATFEAFYRTPQSQRDSMNSFKTASDIVYRIPPSPSPRESSGTNSFKASDDTLVPNSPRESTKSFRSNEGFYNYKPPMSPRASTNSFKSSPESPYRSPQSARDMMGIHRSPPESPYRSPHMQRTFRGSPETPHKSIRGSPEMPHRSFRASPEMPHRSLSNNRDVVIMPSTFRSNPESPYRSPNLPKDGQSSFKPLSDSLYKRPPSPISPSTSSRVSSDSLYRPPSTPRASPNASRARLEAMFRTPPSQRSKKSITENSCYEYE